MFKFLTLVTRNFLG